ncbi:GDYXXLXY domain-containing protein [Peribacillus sp. NPDC097295]|uniref:GDYXXLXY domain-containing protein n=1 Tax=Peribacillus sp. NPDC097295 TaxID=3364402 RepID=UPI00381DD430
MNHNTIFRPLIVFAIPVLILVALAIPPFWTTMFGEEIKIKTAPIDPTDLFRGSYVALGYEIESVALDQLDETVMTDFKSKYAGDYKNVYVTLQQGDDGQYNVDYVSKEKPEKALYLKGKLQIPYDLESASSIHIKYGLDNFYAPKEKAMELEKSVSAKPAWAIVKVKNGNAVLKEIIVPKDK